MSLRVSILGCGSSGGVPRTGGDWGVCDPANPKNRRRRCSMLVERVSAGGITRVLVDTGPDMREQLLDADVPWLDAVVYTHPHADHIHGIDDLRGLALANKARVDVYMDQPTHERLMAAFGYCFEGAVGYPPILDATVIEPYVPLTVQGAGGPVTLTPFSQIHGRIVSLGYRIGDLAYSSDLHDIPDETLPFLKNLDVWIVDALRYKRHPSHFSVEEALGWIARMGARRGILTNLHHDLDYEVLSDELPAHVEPAYDMMVLTASDAGKEWHGVRAFANG